MVEYICRPPPVAGAYICCLSAEYLLAFVVFRAKINQIDLRGGGYGSPQRQVGGTILTQEYLSRLQGRLEKTFQVSGLESDLGVKLEELQDGMVRLSLATAEKHGNVYGIVHGGILASLCDIVMATACVTLKKRIVTLDMNISYIKNAPIGSTLTAVGEVVHNGRTIVRTSGRIYHGEILLASAQASYYAKGDGIKMDLRPEAFI